MNRFFAYLSHVESANEAQRLLRQKTIRQFVSMFESRRLLPAGASTQPPTFVWTVIFGGSASIPSLVLLFVTERKGLRNLLTTILARLPGLPVFLCAVTDFPFRSEFGVGPNPFERVLQQALRT